MRCGPQTERFGQFLTAKFRDAAIGFIERLANGEWNAPALCELQTSLADLTPEQRTLVRRCVTAAVDHGMHDFLFALGEANDFDEGIAVVVDGVDVAGQSDGLQGEPFGPDGWIAKYSRYSELP